MSTFPFIIFITPACIFPIIFFIYLMSFFFINSIANINLIYLFLLQVPYFQSCWAIPYLFRIHAIKILSWHNLASPINPISKCAFWSYARNRSREGLLPRLALIIKENNEAITLNSDESVYCCSTPALYFIMLHLPNFNSIYTRANNKALSPFLFRQKALLFQTWKSISIFKLELVKRY